MARDLAPEVERLMQFRDPNIRKKVSYAFPFQNLLFRHISEMIFVFDWYLDIYVLAK